MEIDRIFISSFSMAATISTLKNVNARIAISMGMGVWDYWIREQKKDKKIKNECDLMYTVYDRMYEYD
jgi:hypothetical protein